MSTSRIAVSSRDLREWLFRAARAFALLLCLVPASHADILIQPTPDEGIQPRLVRDPGGGVHLLYFKKRINRPNAREGNLFYRKWDEQRASFGLPLRVNSTAFNVNTFSIARAALAVGAGGRAHAIWYVPEQGQYYYARSNDAGTAFESQREVASMFREGIDAGADISAAGDQVAVVWGAGDLGREYERTVYARWSGDGGSTFSAEIQLGDTGLGACACCSPAVEIVGDELLVAYRSAIDGTGRHMQLLSLDLPPVGGLSESTVARYAPVTGLQEWELSSCPLSTNDITLDNRGTAHLVFETQYRVVAYEYSGGNAPRSVADPFTETRQKNPTIAVNGEGEVLIAWGEAISHARGGVLNYRLVSVDGAEREIAEPGLEMPQFSFPAAAALENGSFLLLY